jgi:hypothetical protein
MLLTKVARRFWAYLILFETKWLKCAEKGLLTLKSEYPVSGSGFQIIIKFKGRTGLIRR